MLTPAQIKMIKMLQADPEMLARVQDPNAFSEVVAETRTDRNHRFILSAIDARERTNWTNDERDAQDEFISDFCDATDALVSMIDERFKVKSNEKGEAWHALSYQTADGRTFSLKLDTVFTHKPNKEWSVTTVEGWEGVETPATPVVPKAPKARR